ncbi:hypothetical protein FQA47_004114, partial [Oryzias melastigma]
NCWWSSAGPAKSQNGERKTAGEACRRKTEAAEKIVMMKMAVKHLVRRVVTKYPAGTVQKHKISLLLLSFTQSLLISTPLRRRWCAKNKLPWFHVNTGLWLWDFGLKPVQRCFLFVGKNSFYLRFFALFFDPTGKLHGSEKSN